MSPEELATQIRNKPPAPEEMADSLSNQDYGLVGDALGAAEVAGTFATSIPSEVASGLAGVGGLAAQGVSDTLRMVGLDKAANFMNPGDLREVVEGVQSFMTYSPQTKEGQEQIQAIGRLFEPLAKGLDKASTMLGDVGYDVSGPVGGAVMGSIPEAALEVLPFDYAVKKAPKLAKKTATTLEDSINSFKESRKKIRKDLGLERSVGAAQVPTSEVRRMAAEELPVPIKLTEGQKTRDFDVQRFEQETAKLPEIGEPIRKRFEEQNIQLQQNMDEFIDEVGATSFGKIEIGESVQKALSDKLNLDKSKIRALYKKAEESGAMSQNVDIKPLSDYLNGNRAERVENGIMLKLQRQIDALEIGDGTFVDGSLNIRDINLSEAEALRRFINKNVNDADKNDVRVARNLKEQIDLSTEGLGNEDYKAARRARKKLAQDFENVSLMKQLTNNKKGTTERGIALEDVLRKSVISPAASMESLKHLRRVLQNSGESGKGAWKDIQAGVLLHIQDEMIKNVATNTRGDRVVSAARLEKAVRDLDNSGKLEILYGNKGAEKIRTINDVAKTILTSPPGVINHSNTASVLMTIMSDVAFAGYTQIPLPVASAFKYLVGTIKDKKLKQRVKKTLGE